MIMRKRAELDTENPPGTIKWPFPSHSLKPCVNTGQFSAGECSDCREHNEDQTKVVMMAEYFKDKAE